MAAAPLWSGPAGAGVFRDAPDSPDAVGPADFLAFLVGPARVGDADLIDSAPQARDLGHDLGLEAEAVLLDRDLLEHPAREDLVPALHVGQVQVGEDVGEKSQASIGDGVPEVEDAVLVAREEAGAQHNVGASVHDRPEKLRVLVWVVLEVRVLDENDVALGPGESGPEGGTLALVP